MRIKTTLLVFVIIVFSASFVLANGLSLNSIGTRALGMGGAYIGLANDYSAVYWNPAGVAQLKSAYVAFFVTDVMPKGTYQLTFPATMGGAKIDATAKANHYISPNFMAYMPLGSSEKMTVGIAAYVPAGLGAEWDGSELAAFSGPSGTAYEWMSKIGVFNISPVIAYQVNEKFSVGAALNIFYGLMDMKRPMDTYDAINQQPGQDGMVDAQYEETGSGLGFGASFGVLFKPTDILSLGLSVKTKTTISYEGTAKNSAFQAYNAFETDYARDLAWPLWVGAGIALKPMDKLIITADVQFSQWSDTEKEIVTDYKDPVWDQQVDQQGQNVMHMNWEDATQIRFGAQYKVAPSVALRAGFYHDPAPAPDKTTNIIFPSITYNAITFGGSYCFGKISLDFGMEYLMGQDREIPFENGYEQPGTHHMNILAASVGIGYYF
ncbi:hypothetical protein B6D60_12060 [candidate division KSB1 bacterium 4484_87]|nr:MAG: hypothetical protein B6D60_12060 [candidate division KSB1 bacterium 4484_87]